MEKFGNWGNIQGYNLRKYGKFGKHLEKIGKSLCEIPADASTKKNSS